jgi:hypothetical protein
MSHKRLLIAATIIALIIIASFALSVPHTRDVPSASSPAAEKQSVPEVALRDTYRKGVHTITGSIEVPNVCTSVSAEASVVGAGTSIAVNVSTVEDSGVCLERKSSFRFSTTLTAPAGLPVTATVNGVLATTTDL